MTAVPPLPSSAIQAPLSRRGHGPGLIIVMDDEPNSGYQRTGLDPPPLQKWAEEGYAVVQITMLAGSHGFEAAFQSAIESLTSMDCCDDKEKFGIIAYLSPSNSNIADAIIRHHQIKAAVFYNAGPPALRIPTFSHIPGAQPNTPISGADSAKQNFYPGAKEFFIMPGHANYHASSASLAHTRTLTFLKPILGGPYFDIEAVWEEHTKFEFGDRDVDKTMATMVDQPYVNHIPTMTGGVGRVNLTNFYRDHFIFNNPADTELELVSRTVGIDRVIDEFLFKCTHDKVVDWLLPGVPPTGQHLAIPFTSVVNVRGDRLHHEHIAWDQATALRQAGLLPDFLPFPYAIDGKMPAPGKRFEYRLPVGGVETANKLVDESAVESNGMFGFSTREVNE